MKEFSLSDKIINVETISGKDLRNIPLKDVKEFIKKLKEELKDWGKIDKAMENMQDFKFLNITEVINKLAGDKLI